MSGATPPGRSIRRDVTTGSWTVIAPDRAARPALVAPRGLPDGDAAACPFCPGHEAVTGRSIAEIRGPDGWVARAFPNRFPAVDLGEPWGSAGDGPNDVVFGLGAHEVLVEGRSHHVALADQPSVVARAALRLARDRQRDLAGDRRLVQHVWFRNEGIDAGSSQAHPHAQLVALPLVPDRIERLLERGAAFRALHGRDVYDDVRADARSSGRWVAEIGDVDVLCPYAPSADGEVWVLPRVSAPRFRDASDAVTDALADAISVAARGVLRVVGPSALTTVLFTAPEDRDVRGTFSWHVRLIPRRTPIGGLEIATGGGLVGVSPEVAAAAMRGA